MRKFTNTATSVEYDVEDNKAEWFEKDADFTEVFEEPGIVVIKPKQKKVPANKAKVSKKVLKENKEDK